MPGFKGVDTVTGLPAQKTLWVNQGVTVRTVKGSSGALVGWAINNLSNATAYLVFFDTTGTVTLGTTVPDFVIPVATLATPTVLDSVGIGFVSGLKYAVATTALGNGAPNVGIDIALFWQ